MKNYMEKIMLNEELEKLNEAYKDSVESALGFLFPKEKEEQEDGE